MARAHRESLGAPRVRRRAHAPRATRARRLLRLARRRMESRLGGEAFPARGCRAFSQASPEAPALTPQTRIAELLAQRPRAAMVFVRRRMACVGCELNVFDTLAGAARSYGLTVDALIEELRQA